MINSAEVPTSPDAQGVIVTYELSYANGLLIVSIRFSTTDAVIILVSDATYLLSDSHFPKRSSFFFLSTMHHYVALTKGAGDSIISFI